MSTYRENRRHSLVELLRRYKHMRLLADWLEKRL